MELIIKIVLIVAILVGAAIVIHNGGISIAPSQTIVQD